MALNFSLRLSYSFTHTLKPLPACDVCTLLYRGYRGRTTALRRLIVEPVCSVEGRVAPAGAAPAASFSIRREAGRGPTCAAVWGRGDSCSTQAAHHTGWNGQASGVERLGIEGGGRMCAGARAHTTCRRRAPTRGLGDRATGGGSRSLGKGAAHQLSSPSPLPSPCRSLSGPCWLSCQSS